MAKITVEKPEIVVVSFRAERQDVDYHRCLWARFYFDLVNYSMSIASDCGTFGYGWVPTPQTETFLHLMARCDAEYILGKIARRNCIDGGATYESVKETLFESGIPELAPETWEELEQDCYNCDDEEALIESLYDTLIDTEAEAPQDEYYFCECIQMDYPNQAKTICSIFEEHIQPVLRRLENG